MPSALDNAGAWLLFALLCFAIAALLGIVVARGRLDPKPADDLHWIDAEAVNDRR